MPDRATGYVIREGVLKNGEPFRPRVIAASGGILANAADLARWWEAVLKARVVKRASLDEMLAPVKLTNGSTVAHGFAFFTDTFNGHKMIQHFGSTVGGFGSIVRYYPAEDITVAVIGNLEDGGFGAEYIAKRVADFYIPGAFAAGMKEEREVVPGLTKLHLRALMDIAESKPSDQISASYAAKISDTFRKQTAANLQQIVKFSFLGREKITNDSFVLDPTLSEVYHYKMQLQKSSVYYHFRMDKDGKIGWIVFEE